MSSGQKARNPRYFPKMKVRGARRKRLVPFQTTMRALDQFSIAAEEAAKSFALLGKMRVPRG